MKFLLSKIIVEKPIFAKIPEHEIFIFYIYKIILITFLDYFLRDAASTNVKAVNISVDRFFKVCNEVWNIFLYIFYIFWCYSYRYNVYPTDIDCLFCLFYRQLSCSWHLNSFHLVLLQFFSLVAFNYLKLYRTIPSLTTPLN